MDDRKIKPGDEVLVRETFGPVRQGWVVDVDADGATVELYDFHSERRSVAAADLEVLDAERTPSHYRALIVGGLSPQPRPLRLPAELARSLARAAAERGVTLEQALIDAARAGVPAAPSAGPAPALTWPCPEGDLIPRGGPEFLD